MDVSTSHPGGLVARPGGGPRQVAAWVRPAPLWPTLVLLEASVMLIFIYFSRYFWGSRNWGEVPAIKRHQQTETCTGCTELVG